MKTTKHIFLKTLVVAACTIMLGTSLCSCEDEETYADQKEKERKGVSAFLTRDPLILTNGVNDTLLNTSGIKVISEEQFEAQNSTTNVEKNEYVLIGNSGVYMQIVRKGNGKKLQHGESTILACRYWEYNIIGDSLMTTNLSTIYNPAPDYINVYNNYGNFSGQFNLDIYLGGGAMYRAYGSTSVPQGWFVPLTYINLGRQDGEIAKVRLIVPHTMGTELATSNVYPTFYEITYQHALKTPADE